MKRCYPGLAETATLGAPPLRVEELREFKLVTELIVR